jgi:antitoxin FitA
MTPITISLPDDRIQRLQELARRLGVQPEDLVRLSIDELLGRPDEAFEQIAGYILDKNSELYRRLA